ncbi:tRNA uracil 4-sulfurtransferase ThiI [Ignavigranum ruoffiae]|uniref:tRNA uracil 4-sulfurtransferase ThiI n=1 Tax=Ignavigranum ruoffiae TaxID=89093 RepID=UPI0020503396|nr:tRNA uracil 4-sulfurtransferase ThiI [Ignavigranum ruoffiae]UPQ85327.1 tRNA 4-thiouridine(8) synthase ThiI [Ignavigranum ruoffiae]
MKRIVVHYGELSTKGRNRKLFQQRLADHIRYQTKDLIGPIKIKPWYDFMHIEWEEESYQTMIEILKKIPGITRFEPSYQVAKDIEAIKDQARQLFQALNLKEGDSFKVVAKRSDKTFAYDSYDIQRIVGGDLDDHFAELNVSLNHPDYVLTVSIHQGDYAYLSLDSYQGVQGLPYGSSGKGMLMLSGGFDSPIAGYLMIRRGMELEMVHFSSPPYTSPQALEKAKKLTAQLSKYAMPITFHAVPFARIQEAIRDQVHENESMTVMRRIMLRITEALMHQQKGQAIINGESLGQVASQTLTSMQVINEVTSTPILRPLIATDKNDIIKLAEEIGTYDLSNQPYEDCCTVFAPRSPHTKPKLAVIEDQEAKLDLESLIEEALANVQTTVIDPAYLLKEQQEFSDLL